MSSACKFIHHITNDVWSEKQADLYYEILIKSCHGIAKNPNFGKVYEGILEGLCGYKVNKHVIFYRIISNEEIEIVRILHESMDIKNRIRE